MQNVSIKKKGFICLDHYVKTKKIDDFKEKFNGLYTEKNEKYDIILYSERKEIDE